MPTQDRRIDAYIAKSEPFARPILAHIRATVHKGCPDVVETVKWGFPHFTYKGILCSMASFKEHCAFGFWRASLLKDKLAALPSEGKAMGHFGRITSVKDLPPVGTIVSLVKAAAALNDAGVRPARKPVSKKAALRIPKDLAQALRANPKAERVFDAFSPSKRRDYVEWITEARSADTRAKRLATTIGWVSEGKLRNWKYEKKA